MKGILVEIDTIVMRHPPKAKRALWAKATYREILSNTNKQGGSRVIPGQSDHAQKSKIALENIATEMESNSSRQGQVTWADISMVNDASYINSGSQEGIRNEAHVPIMTQRSNIWCSTSESKNGGNQVNLSGTVDTMLSSLAKLSDEMIMIRKDMTQPITTFQEELLDLKWILLAQNVTEIASSRRKRVPRSSSKEELPLADDLVSNVGSGSDSKDKLKARQNAHSGNDSNSWDSMCETYMEVCNTMNKGDSTVPGGNSTRRTSKPSSFTLRK
jgi:hypothetical protein